jgi:hypothetical protein
MTEHTKKTNIASNTSSISRGHKIVRTAFIISILTILLQFSSFTPEAFYDLFLLKFYEFQVLPNFMAPLYVAPLFILPFLYCFLLRGHHWAKWNFLIILSSVGFISFIWPFSFILALLAEGFEFDALLYNYKNLMHFVVASAQLIVASILVFSEHVGDFLDYRGLVEEHWNQFNKTQNYTKNKRLFDRKKIYLNISRRQKFGRLIPKLTIIFVILGWIIFFVYFYQEKEIIYNKINDKDIFFLFKQLVLMQELLKMLSIGYLALFVFPVLISLPWLIPLALSWKKPIHFLLLRPFNRSWITGELRKTIKKEFAPLGYCYTLADLAIRVPLFIRVPFLFGNASLFYFRLRKIRRPKHITRLINGMNRVFIRNLNWYLSLDKLFPVACSDGGWRTCVRFLIQKVDVIIIDISGITENIFWEIELLKDLRAIKRSIFLVNESERLKAEQLMSQLFENYYQYPKLVTYPISEASNSETIKPIIKEILCS